MRYDAIVLAGGSSRRMGGGDKTALTVAGVALLDRVLAAVVGGETRVVVGERRPTLAPVIWAREEPVGGGPAAALAAGLAFVTAPLVVVLAGDLPFVDADSVQALVTAVRSAAVDGAVAVDGVAADGAVAVDDAGAPQWLCGAWRTDALRRLVAAQPVEGLALRRLFTGASYDMISLAGAGGREPWFDCDTPDDLARAKERR
ncbi:MAG: hypothetical protein QOH99_1103 [Frankiaceae bacterium]|nr:hypothetical protein [Frankiaceae bacterium]